MYIYYYLHADSFVRKSNETGTGNTKLQDQEKANTSVEKSDQEPNNLQDKSVYDRNGNENLREDDCEEDIGPHFAKHYGLL